jgi:hypothetical protein
VSIDAAQIQISKSKSQITKCQILNPKFNFMYQILNSKSQIFFLSAKSQIQVPNPKFQIILDLGSIYICVSQKKEKKCLESFFFQRKKQSFLNKSRKIEKKRKAKAAKHSRKLTTFFKQKILN